MTKNYLKEKKIQPLEPKKSTIEFLLKYSKSIQYIKTKDLNVIVNLN